MRLSRFFGRSGAAAIIAAFLAGAAAEACARAVREDPEGRILTGRSMDLKLPMLSTLWVLPRGIARDGAAGPRSSEWTSRFGSLIVSGCAIATADGMNDAGLVANLLWEAEATYPQNGGVTPRIAAASVFSVIRQT